MARATHVPITPSVLEWAIEESGYSLQDIAHAVGVDVASLGQWISGEMPTLTQARKLAAKLHRPFAALLLPSPPERRPLPVQFRQPLDAQREPNPDERRYLRRAARLQEVLSWLAKQLEVSQPRILAASTNDDPTLVASEARRLLRVSVRSQIEWPTPSAAFDEWRLALENTGLLVFLLSMGKNSCNGFSIWDDLAPIVAVNTAWNESARIFTLFHEFGHLVTRTSSACVDPVKAASKADPVERWCQRFAAEALMPAREVSATIRSYGWHSGGRISDLRVAKRLANSYKVSLRAAVIRLIELKASTWDLYEQIPPMSDSKPAGGGGGGRNRTQIREDQLGDRATSLVVQGVERDVLSRSQAVDFLDIPDKSFDQLARASRRTG